MILKVTFKKRLIFKCCLSRKTLKAFCLKCLFNQDLQKISQNPHLNYCYVHDSFGGFDSPCQAIESWYKLITQEPRYKECINNYRINNDLDKLIFCVPSKGYSTSQTWYPQVRSGTISFVNKWGKK